MRPDFLVASSTSGLAELLALSCAQPIQRRERALRTARRGCAAVYSHPLRFSVRWIVRQVTPIATSTIG